MVEEQEQGNNHWSAYGIRQGKKRAFLINYVQTGSVTAAAEAAGVARARHYQWVREDAEYERAFCDAQDRYVERLEREADRRGVEGTDKPVIYQGAITGTYKEYSDNLLMFRLKALKPDKYRERVSQETSGTVKVEATHRHQLDPTGLSAEELTSLGSIVRKLAQPG